MKNVALINAIRWSEQYPLTHPLREVGEWFTQYFKDDANVSFGLLSAEDPLLIAKTLKADGVILSGSPRDAWANDSFTEHLCALILQLQKQSKPFLGVCYGHQILARALGGEVNRDPRGWEVGMTPITLTEMGKRCPLFQGLKGRFEVIQSHKDAVLQLPPGATLLAEGDHTHIQSFQLGENLFGVQFHPEMNGQIVSFLWEPRIHTWQDQFSFNIPERLAAIPQTTDGIILKNFVKYLTLV